MSVIIGKYVLVYNYSFAHSIIVRVSNNTITTKSVPGCPYLWKMYMNTCNTYALFQFNNNFVVFFGVAV